MRIIHTSDWHLGDRLGRVDRTADIRRAVERVAALCQEERAEVLLIAGDLFSELLRPDSLREAIAHLQDTFGAFLRGGGTLVAITGNHDNETFCQTLRLAIGMGTGEPPTHGALRQRGRLHLLTNPTFFQLPSAQGQLVQFVALPYPRPDRYLREESMQRLQSREERNRHVALAYTEQLALIQAHPAFDVRLRTVLAAHVHVHGGELSTRFQASEREEVIYADRDLPTGWDYVGLGHIHRAQPVRGLDHVRYCGSLERLDLGEKEDQKGVVLVELGPEGLVQAPRTIALPATPIYEVTLDDAAAELPRLRERFPDAATALVKLRLRYQAGRDDLLQILRGLDEVFPRCYEREIQEAHKAAAQEAAGVGETSGGEEDAGESARSAETGFAETVLSYLTEQLAGQPLAAKMIDLARGLVEEAA